MSNGKHNLATKVSRFLRDGHPIYGNCVHNVITVMDELERKFPGCDDRIADSTINNGIESAKPRLAKDPAIELTVRSFQKSHPEINWHIASTGLLLEAAANDLTEAGLSYALGQLNLEKSQYGLELEADRRAAEKDRLFAASTRQELLAAFMKQEKVFLKNSGNNVHAWQKMVRDEQKRLDGLSVDQLREAKAARDWKLQTAAEAEAARGSRNTDKDGTFLVPPTPYQTAVTSESNVLPMSIPNPKPGMEHLTLDLSSQGLKKLAASDYGLFKYIVRENGPDAVNARLNGIN